MVIVITSLIRDLFLNSHRKEITLSSNYMFEQQNP